MNFFTNLNWTVTKILNGGRINYSKLSKKRKEKLISQEVERFIYHLLELKDISLGINFLDEVNFYIREYNQHPSIKFKDREEVFIFYSEVYGRYATSVILQYFRLIIQQIIFDVYFAMTDKPSYHTETRKMVVLPIYNLNTRSLVQINLSMLQHEISEETCKLYTDPTEFISFAFPLISEFDYKEGFIKDLYITNVLATQAVVRSVKGFLSMCLTPEHLNVLYPTFLYCLMEYHNDTLVNLFDEDQELIQLGLKNETLSIMFGILYEIEDLLEQQKIDFGPLMNCLHPSVIVDKYIYDNLLEYRSSMIAVFISSLGIISAQIKKTCSEPDDEPLTNVVDFLSKKEIKGVVEDTKDYYCLLADKIITQLKNFRT